MTARLQTMTKRLGGSTRSGAKYCVSLDVLAEEHRTSLEKCSRVVRSVAFLALPEVYHPFGSTAGAIISSAIIMFRKK